jgi:hypothetical protein
VEILIVFLVVGLIAFYSTISLSERKIINNTHTFYMLIVISAFLISVCGAIVINSSNSSGTFTNGCVWTDTTQGIVTKCPNSATISTYSGSNGKASH